MSGAHLIAYGVLGGFFLYVFAVVFPDLSGATAGGFWANLKRTWADEWPSVILMLGVYLLLGGFAAWYLGHSASTARDAVTYGLSWPALFKGIGEGLYRAGKAHGG